MKQCNKCKELKPIEEFYKCSKKPDGYDIICKMCDKSYEGNQKRVIPDYKICLKCGLEKHQKEFYKRNRNKDGLRNECKLCNYKKATRNFAKRPRRQFYLRIFKEFGITQEQYDAMRESQNNLCFLCNRDTNRLCLDHNHSNNKVRKLLCQQCNAGLGMFMEDIGVMNKAIEYIKAFNDEEVLC